MRERPGRRAGPRPRVWLGLNAFMLLLFALSAAAQYNDPEPVRWTLIYAAAAVACALELARRGGRAYPALVALVAVAWGLTALPAALAHRVGLSELLLDMGMKAEGVEEAREAIGLFLVAGWTALLARRAHVRARAAVASADTASGPETAPAHPPGAGDPSG